MLMDFVITPQKFDKKQKGLEVIEISNDYSSYVIKKNHNEENV